MTKYRQLVGFKRSKESVRQICKKAFPLERYVCLHSGVQHEIIMLTDPAPHKNAEKLNVNSEFYDFEHTINIALISVKSRKEDIQLNE